MTQLTVERAESKEAAKREAVEVKRDQQAEARAKWEAKKAVGAELNKGVLELAIAPTVDYRQMRELEECLCRVQDLRVLLVGGSVDEGNRIVVSIAKPMPLTNVLREIPPHMYYHTRVNTLKVILTSHPNNKSKYNVSPVWQPESLPVHQMLPQAI